MPTQEDNLSGPLTYQGQEHYGLQLGLAFWY